MPGGGKSPGLRQGDGAERGALSSPSPWRTAGPRIVPRERTNTVKGIHREVLPYARTTFSKPRGNAPETPCPTHPRRPGERQGLEWFHVIKRLPQGHPSRGPALRQDDVYERTGQSRKNTMPHTSQSPWRKAGPRAVPRDQTNTVKGILREVLPCARTTFSKARGNPPKTPCLHIPVALANGGTSDGSA